jgi:O-antigen/teichoic acid export membrane protein
MVTSGKGLGQTGYNKVNIIQRLIKSWKSDAMMQKVIRNTGYLFSSNTIAMALGSAQGIIAGLLLGPSRYGILCLGMTLVTNLNRLFSFRMSELVIKFGGQDLAVGNKQRAAAIVKAAFFIEAITTIFAYIVLVLTAPLTVQWIIKDTSVASWIGIYGLSLLFNLVNETSTAVLQLGNHFRSQAMINFLQSIITALLIMIAYFRHGTVFDVMLAYLFGKMINGSGIFLITMRKMKNTFGDRWWKAPLHLIEKPATMVRFAISTNLSGTINLFNRDSDLLWVGFFLSPAASGYYKFASGMMNVLLMPITPFISTTFPEISSSVAHREWSILKKLLFHTSGIATIWTSVCTVGVLVFGYWGLSIISDGAFLPSFSLILILILGYGFANIFFWSRPLLLAFEKPYFPLLVTFVVGLGKIVLMFHLIPQFGVNCMAWLMSGYFLITVGIITARGLKLVRIVSTKDSQL